MLIKVESYECFDIIIEHNGSFDKLIISRKRKPGLLFTTLNTLCLGTKIMPKYIKLHVYQKLIITNRERKPLDRDRSKKTE